MGEIIRKNAASEAIMADIGITLTNAAAKGGLWTTLAEQMLRAIYGLSLDIDRNTYWVWEALTSIRPRVVVIEYNALYPPPVDWIVEYRAERAWKGTSYFGASLCAYERLGREKRYALVGCSLNGVNAFFVREELCGDLFDAPFTAARHYEPVRYFLIRRNGFPRAMNDDPVP